MKQTNLKTWIQHFPPVYFAVPMSTGIISVASFILGYKLISDVLFVINNIELVILSVILLVRLMFFLPDFKRDLASSEKGAGFLTIVVASCILGTKNVIIRENPNEALLGWTSTFIIWLVLIYGFFFLISIKREKVALAKHINGSWLLFVVSAQALSVSGNLVSNYFAFEPQMTLLVTLALFLLGGLFYIILIGLIFYRFTFFRMEPKDFKPSYWINMGAAAISTLAGAILIKTIGAHAMFEELVPTLKVLTLLFWIGGTWWIPIIIALEIWKRLKVKVTYKAGYWSLVFPLGIYTVCTWQMADAMYFTFLKRLPEITIYFAWAAWLITYVFMLKKTIALFYRKSAVQ